MTSGFDAGAAVHELEENPCLESFTAACAHGNLVPMWRRFTADQLSPIQAYRCLVPDGDTEAPSFLFESVTNGTQTGRYSMLGAKPVVEVLARGNATTVVDRRGPGATVETATDEADPLSVPERLSANWRPVRAADLPPGAFTGGWVGFTGYDTVRYVYPTKAPFSDAPPDTAGLPDLHLALYQDVVVFDQATKLVYAVCWVDVAGEADIAAAHAAGHARLEALTVALTPDAPPRLPVGAVRLGLRERSVWSATAQSDLTRAAFLEAVETAKEHIRAGDVFQLVLSHRFERRTDRTPFEVYRALRVVNPSPYMVYLQAPGCVLVASSPEILCRVDRAGVVTNRPLAGTRRRGVDAAEDVALETELLADEKERSEHIMLVDLGRNDVGKVAEAGSVSVDKLMEVERYSHVMHISSTVTGALQAGLTAWDALRSALPAGTISGAPKVRALQIIDDLEAAKRGPYGGGIGHVGFTGELDMCLALRTMIVPTLPGRQGSGGEGDGPATEMGRWRFLIQAGAGVVADSSAEAELEETVNKAAALARAIDLAEDAF